MSSMPNNFFGQHRHAFSKWTIISEGPIKSVKTGAVIGQYIIQQRKCEECGFSELNEQSTG